MVSGERGVGSQSVGSGRVVDVDLGGAILWDEE